MPRERPDKTTARVVFDYDADDEEKALPLHEGETIQIIRKLHHGWWLGKNSSGHVGRFPAALVQEDDESGTGSADLGVKLISTPPGNDIHSLPSSEFHNLQLGSESHERDHHEFGTGVDSKLLDNEIILVQSEDPPADAETNLEGGTLANPSSSHSRATSSEATFPNASTYYKELFGNLESKRGGNVSDGHSLNSSQGSEAGQNTSYNQAKTAQTTAMLSQVDVGDYPYDDADIEEPLSARNVSQNIKNSEDLFMPAVRDDLDVPIPSDHSFRTGSHSLEPNNARLRDISPGSRALSTNPCGQCGRYSQANAFCNKCKATFCDACWDAQYLHGPCRSQGPGEIHEKTDLVIAETVLRALEAVPNDPMQEEWHKQDAETSWFGTARSCSMSFLKLPQTK